MKLLFVQGGTRLKKDSNGNYYTDGNLNNNIWDRYKKYCDTLLVLLRKEEKIYKPEYANKQFNPINVNNVKIYEMHDLMRPKRRFVSVRYRNIVKKEIKAAVLDCDKAIIRSTHNFYTLTAVKMCRKYHKPYLIEVAGYAFDGYWYHGDLYGKISAIPYELLSKCAVKRAKYCAYVTNYSLQRRYPCDNQTLGCSDVELKKLNNKNLVKKIEVLKNKEKYILGTIGWINLKVKGQQNVIRALGELKKNGIDNFEYQLVGLGSHEKIDKLIKKYNLEDDVKIIGALPHEKIFEWLKNIDIYIQPSYQEGLCRSLIEAMSLACPVIASNVGGNSELVNEDFLFEKGKYKQLKDILRTIKNDKLVFEAKRSFELAKNYEKNILDKKRDDFYLSFITE